MDHPSYEDVASEELLADPLFLKLFEENIMLRRDLDELQQQVQLALGLRDSQAQIIAGLKHCISALAGCVSYKDEQIHRLALQCQ
jgi:hypothetical protein